MVHLLHNEWLRRQSEFAKELRKLVYVLPELENFS